jgi:hypothetical protein
MSWVHDRGFCLATHTVAPSTRTDNASTCNFCKVPKVPFARSIMR